MNPTTPRRAIQPRAKSSVTAATFICLLAAVGAQGQPSAPTGLSVAVGDASAVLTWGDPSNSSIIGYSVRQATSSEAFSGPAPPKWTPIAGSTATTTTHTVTDLANGTRYWFQLRAANSDGAGPTAQATIQLAVAPGAVVTIPDVDLRSLLELYTGKDGAAITQLDMARLGLLQGDLGRGWAWDVWDGWWIRVNRITNLTGLEHAVNLRHLSLAGHLISDVSPLGDLTSLRYLDLANNTISNVSPLGGLTSLEELALFVNAISDVSPLGGLTSLEELALFDNAISDVSPLGDLTSLRYLNLANNTISNVSTFWKLTSLTDLDLANNAISDVRPLQPLQWLRYLDLSNNTISDIRVLWHLSLWHLDLSGNTISDVSALGNPSWPWLKRLDLSNNTISDVSALENQTRLEWLDLSNNSISNVSALGSLSRIALLLLSGNAISDVSALGNLASLRWLWLDGNAISDVSALRSLPMLRELDLANNAISDVSALGNLASLHWLWLDGNAISEVSALGNLGSLTRLDLSNNAISDVSALGSFGSLWRLYLSGNTISDVSALGNLAPLTVLDLANNAISDVSALGGLASLHSLLLSGNRVADVEPLSSNSGLGEGDVVRLRGNPLSAASIEDHLPALRVRGVGVLAGDSLPFLPAAGNPSGHDGFVRVINRSNRAGEVLVYAVDDAGVRAGPAQLALAAGAAAHFNAADLEAGNAAKGLVDGVGASGVAGGWRLELLSTLDIEALAYARTPDGFVTSLHDTLPRDDDLTDFAGSPVLRRGSGLLAAVFNPGSSQSRSSLRLLNPAGAVAFVVVEGVDDAGQWRRTCISDRWGCEWWEELLVPAGGALTVDAAQLERGRNATVESGLGTGTGKWRLEVQGPSHVEGMSLLTSPGGQMTNLSTVPAAGADGVWRMPLFPVANEVGRQGFVRVTNRSRRAGEVVVRAADDGGYRAGPVSLALGVGETIHLNSTELERGNAAKGLPVGVGAPTRGDWRLALVSDLDIQVTSFVRHAGGFLTAMHDVAPWSTAESSASVPFFNPGSNRNQVSLLRLINDGEANATVTIAAVDDAGVPGGAVDMTIPAGEAWTLDAAELEVGGANFRGAFGDGEGMWRLTVSADAPVTAMSLLESPGGFLTNLSTTPRARP